MFREMLRSKQHLTKDECVRILKEQTEKGTAVVMVTHNSRWTQNANRRMRLEDGILTDITD